MKKISRGTQRRRVAWVRLLQRGRMVPWSKIEQEIEMPNPAQLAAGLRTKKTSIGLTEYALEKFNHAGATENVPYQQLMREVLDWYARKYLDSSDSP